MTDNNVANERAIKAAESTEALDRFLADEQQHILKLTGKVLNKNITTSDDEYSVALLAVSEAVKTYDGTKGDFWSYA
ncbi:MAG: RNA polymerase subunit sigma, partial [Lachnospiraceae bacterium]|nr:RNA polymerase subunit sigma [Lachnospiraceae bacterium]